MGEKKGIGEERRRRETRSVQTQRLGNDPQKPTSTNNTERRRATRVREREEVRELG